SLVTPTMATPAAPHSTPRPTETPTALLSPASSNTPSLKMTTTETPQPQETLMIRRPSAQQLIGYLQSFFPDLDVYPDDDLGIVYKAVNGDAKADLISHGINGVFVLIWSEQRYLPPFGIQGGWSRAMAPEITIALQDWTGDHVPEIVYDETGLGGG